MGWDELGDWIAVCMLTYIYTLLCISSASQVTQWQRICLPMQGMLVWCLGLEDPLEKEVPTHCSILAWGIL